MAKHVEQISCAKCGAYRMPDGSVWWMPGQGPESVGEDCRPQAAAPDLLAALKRYRKAMQLTREYVGVSTLPARPGWSWFDADEQARAAIDAAEAQPPQ